MLPSLPQPVFKQQNIAKHTPSLPPCPTSFVAAEHYKACHLFATLHLHVLHPMWRRNAIKNPLSSPYCRYGRVFGHACTAMHGMSTPSSPSSLSLCLDVDMRGVDFSVGLVPVPLTRGVCFSFKRERTGVPFERSDAETGCRHHQGSAKRGPEGRGEHDSTWVGHREESSDTSERVSVI